MHATSTPACSIAFALALAGCGSSSTGCALGYVLIPSPAKATASHMAAAPGNQQQFMVVEGTKETPSSGSEPCPVPQDVQLIYPTWTNPDPDAITISSANNATNGTAMCKNATAGAVTLTATTTSLNGNTITTSLQLTCE